MQKQDRRHLLYPLRISFFITLVVLVAVTSSAQTRADNPYYARVNTFGIFGAYSNDSSHMLLGSADNRKLLDLGLSYSRRLMLGHLVNWQYNAELLPVALESDPVVHKVFNQTLPTPMIFVQNDRQVSPCRAGSGSYDDKFPGLTFAGTFVTTCTRDWTIGEAFSPVGMQWNFFPRHKIQPMVIGHGGYMYSTRTIPIDYAGSFNFTFDVGVGAEFFRNQARSIRVEYRYHHISNHDTGNLNPGIDNGLVQATYNFGR